MKKSIILVRQFRLFLSLFVFTIIIGCKNRNQNHDWRIYKADNESSCYSELNDVNTKNVHQLKVVWIFRPDDAADSTRYGNSECNPIVIDGVMYVTSARHRAYAINASNGEQIWSFDPFDGGRGGGVCRGVTYWEDGADKRILFTAGDNLFALNAQTGKLIDEFGIKGRVSMNVGIRDDPDIISIKPTSPGIVYKDLIIIGNEVSELYGAQPGYIRAYNIKNGKLEWTFHTIPKPGELGYDTWPKDAWKYAGGANDWAGMSIDEKRGIVFLATGSPTYDFYGADRKGKNLFGNCVVALDAKTGKHIWHFQTIHHDLWDYDLPAPPNLVTVEKNGKKIDAVAQTSKVGFLYLLDRETGESIFPIEERSVPASDVPGEEAWPTQPFPLKPKPYARQFISSDDLNDFSTASRDSVLKKIKELRYEGLFTPPSTKGTLVMPGTIGGSEWGGAAYDPNSSILYLKSNDAPEIGLLQKIEPAQKSLNQSGYSNGLLIYKKFCASCHRDDKKGDEPFTPSLIGLQNRMSTEEVLNKIKNGSGKMPSFSNIINGNEKAIINFLFQDKKLTRKESELLEISTNESALKESDVTRGTDTNSIYLNLSAYVQFESHEGHPAIKPPWGTLHAINLNSGEYEWSIPVGNHPELQKKGAPITGTESSPGPIVTAGGLVFLSGMRDKKFQAFDKTNGKLIWETILPAAGSSTPCTYKHQGKQYIAISVAGNKDAPGGYVISFALPD